MAATTEFRRLAGLAFGSLVLFAFATGCNSEADKGTVSGTVTVDGGVPAEGSSINFISTTGGTATAGGLIEKGKYSVKVPVGTSKVEIRVPRPTGGKGRPAPKAGPGSGADAGGMIEESLPPEYNEKSTLTLDVKSGDNEKNWELKSKK